VFNDFTVKTAVNNLQQVRIVPRNRYLVIEVIYKIEIKKQKEIDEIKKQYDNEYLNAKKEVEEKWFFVKDIGKFIMHDEKRNKFLIHGKESTILSLLTSFKAFSFKISTFRIF
jgi:transcription termination factor NusB